MGKRSRIFFINQTNFYGGGEVYLMEVINGLLSYHNPEDLFLYTPLVENLVSNLKLPKENIIIGDSKYISFIKSAGLIKETIKNKNIDLIILNGNKAIYLAPFLDGTIPVLGIKHTSILLNSGIKRFFSIFLLKRCFKYLNQLIVISKAHKQELISCKVASPGKIQIIYNGVKLPEEVKKFPTPFKDQIQIIIVGRIEKKKGHFDLVRALSNLRKSKIDNFFLNIFGEGKDNELLRSLVAELDLQKHVKFHGFSNSINQELMNADIFVLPSYSEGVPLSLLEAMAVGLPCITTYVGGIPEIMNNNEDGFLFYPGKVALLEKHLKVFLTQKEIRDKFGENGQLKVQSFFSQQKMLQSLNEVIVTLLPQ